MAGKILLTPGNRLHIKFDQAMMNAQIEGLGARNYPAVHATGAGEDGHITLFDAQGNQLLLFTGIKQLGVAVVIARFIGPVPLESLDMVRAALTVLPDNGACEECGEPPYCKHKLDCSIMRAAEMRQSYGGY